MNGCSFVHCAEDTTVTLVDPNLEAMYDDINSELHLIDDWLRCIKLSLNVHKTSYILYGNRIKDTNSHVIVRG